MKKALHSLSIFIPSGAISLSLLILPIVLTTYFLISQYSSQFLASQESVPYTAADQTFLGRLLVEQPWTEWLSRFSDFAFWGVLAAVVLVLIWAVSVARTSMQNHTITEGFKNFKVKKAAWHSHFAVEVGLKVLLVGIGLYAIILLLARAIPGLAVNISLLLESVSSETVLEIVKSNLYIFGLELLIACVIKIFRHVQLD